MTPLNDERLWRAVLDRDRGLDGAFVYGVRTTGIYCRPSCPSRRPKRRAVVRFFAHPDAAERAGFRACRRCHPREAAAADPWVERVRCACEYIEANPESQTRLATLAARLRCSPHHLQRTFKRIVGVSPKQYAEACRSGRVRQRLKEGQPVADALYEAGYGSSSRLYERAPAELGMTPAAYRTGGAGARIQYTIADSPLGRLLVAATPRGICSVKLGNGDRTLEAELRREYAAAEIARDDARLAPAVRALLAHLSGRQPHLDLPVDVRATAFQWRVWQELKAIPYGATRSYRDIARRIGNEKAVRAVARACATNPVAVVIPCHRVVQQNGGAGGYRWGVPRKEALLAQEQKVAVR